MNILDFIESPDLTPGSFEGDSWGAMKAVLSGAFALPMDQERLSLFKELAGGREPPQKRVRELWVVAGRRSAKSNTSAATACYMATVGAELEGLTDKLKPGERGVVSLIAVDREQAKVLFSYVMGILEASPMLAGMIEKKNAESVDLTNGISIEVHTNSFKAVRGRTLILTIMDECAFYRDENSASPDLELYRAIVPGLATTGGLLIGISSPYARKGLLYNKWKKHYGQNSDVLVVQGSTLQFNPTLNPSIVQEALQDDPAGAKSEWLGQFRDDVSDFLTREVVDSVTRTSPLELPPQSRVKYRAFVDPAGGGKDEFCVGIAHSENGLTVVDVVRGMRGTPAAIVAEYADLLKSYRITKATSDRYAGSWPADEFKKHGVTLEQSAKPKSQLYLDALSVFNSGQVQTPPCEKLATQLCQLERRTSRSGQDSIDHPPGGCDDRSNVVAGLLSNSRSSNYIDYSKLL